jgi:Large polyvalent protein associated domain 38
MASALSRTERMRAAAGAALDRFRIGAQDKMLRLKRVQAAVEAARGAALPTNQDAYLAEELYHKVGELLERFRVERIEPLADAIAKAEVTVDQVNDFLQARGAPERNAQIAKINPDMPDGGSGWTNAEAKEALDAFRAAGIYDALNEIATKHVDPIIRATRDVLTAGDLVDAETRIQWMQIYKHYVPYRGFEQGGTAAERLETERARIGRGFDIRGDESKRALGRESRAGDTLAYIMAQYEEAVVRAEKNKVGKAFLRLVQANPNPALWEIDTAPLKRVIDNKTGLVTYEHDPRYVLADNVMAVKVGGEAHYITIHDPLLARAMKNLGPESMNGFIRAVNSVIRLLAKLLTQWNPAFTIPNLIRDLQTALINIQAQDVPQIAGQIARDIPAAMKGAFQGSRGAKETEWQRWYREFGEAGGKISFFGLEDIETRAKQIRAMVRDLGPGNVAKTRRTLRATGQLISDLNGAVENATRLSAYANLRRKGVPKEKAASIARNLTVNFNRRGEWGPYLNAAYLFYNASLQGSVTMVKALARSRKVQAIAAGGILLGALQDILNHALSPDDDDTGENRWDAKIGEWTKDHNLVFMNPWAESDDNMVAFKLPLPYGYNIFPAIGRRISETLRGKEGATAAHSAGQIVAGTFDSFSPVGSGSTLFDGWEGFVRGLSPTLMQPMVEIAVNMDYKGDPIQRSKEQYGRPIPEHMRGFRNTGPVAEWVTKQLAELTGGSDVRSGAIDVSPAAIDHLAEFFTGGAGRTLKQALELPVRGIEGDWDEFSNPRNWPVMNRFIEGKNQWYDSGRYYDIAGAVEITEAEMKAAAKIGDTARQNQIRKEFGAEVAVIGRFRVTNKRLSALRKALAAAEAGGDEKAAEELQRQITELQRAAIRAYVEALRAEPHQ